MMKTVLITGVAGGIGHAAVEAFLDAGWQVYGIDRRSPERALDGLHFITCDLTDPEAIEAAIAAVARESDMLDALVNNAALQICKPLSEMPVEEWDQVMAANLRAPFLTFKYSYPLLKKARGSIVNISSVHAVATSKEIAAYAASKGGLVALTRAMSIELAPDQIRVNAVLPGAVDTGMLREGLSRGHVGGGTIEDRMEALAARTVIGRVGKPEEIAKTILFLANNDQSSFITGQSFIIDGGATARLSTE